MFEYAVNPAADGGIGIGDRNGVGTDEAVDVPGSVVTLTDPAAVGGQRHVFFCRRCRSAVFLQELARKANAKHPNRTFFIYDYLLKV